MFCCAKENLYEVTWCHMILNWSHMILNWSHMILHWSHMILYWSHMIFYTGVTWSYMIFPLQGGYGTDTGAPPPTTGGGAGGGGGFWTGTSLTSVEYWVMLSDGLSSFYDRCSHRRTAWLPLWKRWLVSKHRPIMDTQSSRSYRHSHTLNLCCLHCPLSIVQS